MATFDATDVEDELTRLLADVPGGVAVLIVRNGVTTALAVGERNHLGEAMTASTPSRVGSVTKPFIATVVLQLVDEGRVDLDAALGTYLPDTSVGGDVTIRDLLRHRSGLNDYTAIGDFLHDTLADRSRRFVPDELLTYIEPFVPAPAGERYSYSNTNYVLLGQLIEHVDGVDLGTALRTRITEPLGMEITRLEIPGDAAVEELAGGWSPGVVEGDPNAAYDSISSGAWAAGALVSTTAELATFLAALFAGDLTSDAALAEMTDTGPDGYGLGLGSGEFVPGKTFYGHAGEVFGYLTFTAIHPETGDIVVILANNDSFDMDAAISAIFADW